MHFVTPQVFHLADPSLSVPVMMNFLKEIDAQDWDTDAVNAAEALPEIMGRLCYRSFEPGLNPNVTKVREGNKAYLENIFDVGHGSVLEHTQLSFIFHNVSRVFTHELVRHRTGTAISQESLRFVRLGDLGFWFPDWFTEDEEALNHALDLITYCEREYNWFVDHFKLDQGGFFRKKQITSVLRRLIPHGVSTSVGWSANARTLVNVIQMRTDRQAEEEIRLVFDRVAQIVTERYPNLFGALTAKDVRGCGEWTLGGVKRHI